MLVALSLDILSYCMYIMFLDVTHQHSDKKWVPQSRSPFFSPRSSRPAPRQNGNCHFASPPLARALADINIHEHTTIQAPPSGRWPIARYIRQSDSCLNVHAHVSTLFRALSKAVDSSSYIMIRELLAAPIEHLLLTSSAPCHRK